jgi:uncharacterized repeat protein (TIGR02543 family)
LTNGGAGGAGGGGAGGGKVGSIVNGTAGNANTGGGGGSGSTSGSTSGAGGSGVVIVRYAMATLTPTFGTPTATADGFTVQISNFNAGYTWSGTATASGSVAVSNTGLVTVTGVAPGTSSTATITNTTASYTGASATVSATSSTGSALTPTFGTPTATVDGFTVQITNYSGSYTWGGTASASGTVSVSGTGLVTVTGVAANTSSTATITTTRTGYTGGTATVSATSLPTCSPTSVSSGGYTILTFTASTTCSWSVPAGVTAAEVLVVGGGGGGGGAHDNAASGGGGAGYVYAISSLSISGTISIAVGAGGTGGVGVTGGSPQNGNSGGNSTFGSVTALGGAGGFGGYESWTGSCPTFTTPVKGGTAATPSQAATGGQDGCFNRNGFGGGGQSPTQNQTGGAGLANSITGTSVTYGTGGTGGTDNADVTPSAQPSNSGNGGTGAASRASFGRTGGTGGSGVVIVRYANGDAAGAAITTQPSGAVSRSALTTQPVIRIVDGSGTTVTSSTVNVVATIASGNGTLTGTTTVAAVNGVATFTNLVITGTGNHTLTFTPTSLAAATSSSFAVSETAITANALTSKVTAPVRAATPSTTAVDDTQFTGTVAWFESNGTTAAPSTFAANTVYVAKVTLTAKTGYTLTGLSGSFTYTGATSVTYSSGVVTITFVATDLAPRTISFATTAYSKAYLETQTVSATPSLGSGSVTYSVGSSTACTVSGSTVTISSGTGTCSVTASVASDGTYASASTTTPVTITVSKAVSTIGLSVGTYTYTGSGLGPDSATTSGSTGAVTYAYAGRDSTSYTSSPTKPTAVGTYTVTATLAADANYASVSTASQNFEITSAGLVVTPTISASSMVYGTSGGSLPTILHTKNPDVSLTTNPTCALYLASDTGFVTVQTLSSTLAVGSYVVRCAGAAATNYTVTYGTNPSFSVTKANQGAISLPVLSATSKTFPYSQTSLTVNSVTGGSGTGALSISAVVDGTATGCSLSGSTLSATSAGTCTLTVTKAADSNFEVATTTATFTFSKATQTISITSTAPASAKVAGTTYTVTATGGASGNAVIFTSTTVSVCTVSRATVTFLTVGTCTIAANQALTSDYDAATQATQSFTVAKGDPSLSSFANVTKTFGDSAFTLTAPTVANSLGGAFTYASGTIGTATISTATVTIVAAGTSVITATFTPTDTTNYNTATITMTLTVSEASALTPTFGTPTRTNDGYTVQITNHSASYVWSGIATASGVVSISGTGLVTVTSVAAGVSSNATITATRTSYSTGTATVSASALASYTISYSGGTGGSGSAPTSPTSVRESATFTTPANTYTRTGYTFAGWSDGTNTLAAAATYPSTGSVSANVTLTATWTEITPAAAFYAEDYTAGSTSWTDRIASATGTTATGGMTKSTSPTSVVFAGRESSNSDRVSGSLGSLSGVSAITVEMWLRLDDSGSAQNAAGSMLFSWNASSGTPNYNVYHFRNKIGFNTINSEVYGIDSSTLEQKWKHFVFVMTNSGNVSTQKIYVNGELQSLSYVFGTAMRDTRNFNANGDFLLMDNPYSSNVWNAKGKLGLARIYKGELNSTQVTSLYDVTKSTYEQLAVIFDAQGGSSVDSGTAAIGGSVSSAPTTPSRSGYTFSGWSATSSGSLITFPYTHNQTADFTLFAIWAPNSLTVTFNSQSGTDVANGTVATNATLSAPTPPTRAGYTFSGWSTTSSGSVVSFTGGYVHGQTASFTLYAIWSANALTVTYDSKGGTAVTSGTVNTAASISSAPTAPTRTGYTFSAWSATDGGTAITFPYAHGQTANFTLYALWTADGNVVAFDNNSGSGTMSNQSIVSGTATAITTNSFTRTGYTFAGWNTAANGSGAAYTNGQSITITAGMTLYAQWTGTTNTITYDSKGGTSVSNGSFVTGGAISSAPTTPARAGYTLSGWSLTDGGSVITYPYSPTATSGITLYAIWAAVSCSPTSSTAGGYTIYTFTTAGTCFWTVPNGVTDVEILAVAGGGGGGYSWDNAGAGGGAGGQVRTGTATLSTTLEVTVGAGGTAGTNASRRGGTGASSVVSTVTALGGTGGCQARATTCSIATQATALAGAAGGAGGAGGASGRGGGGSNTAGLAPTTTTGGTGTASTYSGSSVTYGVGGAGGTNQGSGSNITGTTGSANTGNGGGGASAKSNSGEVNGGAGGAGLVIVRVASALTVTYDSQSGSDVAAGSALTGGSIATAPTDPTRSNYTFLGWFTATSGGSAIAFPYAHGQTANFTLYARWALNTYAIVFNTNNGSGTMANQSVTHGVAANLNANLFTRANYVFHRWATAANGTGTTYNNLAEITLTAGTTLYAQWTANTYVVTYSYNGANGGESPATSSFTTAGSAIVLPVPTRTGFTFAGWHSDAALSTLIGSSNGSGNYSPTGTTLSLNAYAKWTAIDYTFTYNANSASSGSVPTETSKQITQTATVKANTGSLERTGYTFNGWNTASNGTGDNYLSGSLFTVASSNVTLYAKWTANTYTITYNSNGGSGSAQRSSANVASDTFTTGNSSVVLPDAGTLTRSGYTFDGWNTSAAGTGTNRAAADTFTTVSDVIFYAKWNPITYTITYNGNTSDGGTTPTTGGYTTGQSSPYSVVANTFTKTSNVFGGWNTASNGTGTSYSPGATITTLTNIVLYATWIPQFTLHYAINGGTVSSGSLPADQLYNTGTSVGPIFSSVTRTGYTFGGWTNGSTTVSGGGNFTILADSVLTAKWTAIDYAVTYNSDGGTTPPSSIVRQIGQSYTIGNAPAKPGYDFAGWKTGTTVVGAGATIVMGSSDTSYTAQWTAQVYRISYDWNGGRGTAVSDVDYTFGTTAITLPVVGDRVRDGYTFAGWSETLNGSALNATYIPSQTRTLFARWNIGNFTVTYNAGRGTVANASVPVANGGSTVLPLPTRANFVFNGWYTATTGGSSVGSNGASFTPLASQTVYARWIQSSLFGITDSLTRIGSVITADNVSNTFSGANSNSSVAVSVPANALPTGTTINFDLVGNSSRAVGLLPGVTYVVSMAISWLTADETVPDTASGKPISVTITNSSIKAGAVAYAIVNNVSTLLGTATQDGSITVSLTSDPEVVVAATKPGAPTSVAATSNGAQQSVVSWSAPSSNGGAAISGYTVTASPGTGTCTTSSTSCTISSLTNGTAYSFTVIATNSVGNSAASSAASATTAALHTVTFDAKGGSTVTAGSFLTTSTVSEPTAPTRAGYSFAGWSATDGGTVEVFPYAPGVATNITMYAKWDALDNAVTFDSKGGSAVTASVFSSGGNVLEPTAPTLTGFTFAGWSATDGGTRVTFPYAPGVVTDITLYAKWTAVSQSSSGSSGSNASTAPADPAPSTGGTPVRSNVTVVAPVVVVGTKDAKVLTVEISTPAAGSTTKPPAIKLDAASEKFIADLKVVDGKLTLTPETGFSGRKTVTVTITENGTDRIIQIPLTVLPEPVAKPVLTPTASNRSLIRWTESPNAEGYAVLLNGKRVCTTTATSCSVKQVLGPDAVIEIVSTGGDRTFSQRIEADFRQNVPVPITRIVSATNTKATLSRVDTKALDSVVALIRTQGFGTVVISQISTNQKTAPLAAARIAAIKKYIDDRTGTREITFEIVPAASRTNFNNISVKG